VGTIRFVRVWIINPFDPVPGEGERPGRYALLARALLRRGHAVTWVTSTFSHRFKAPREIADIQAAAGREGLRLLFVRTRAYQRNVGWRRLLNHAEFAAGVRALDVTGERADLVVASTPPPGSAHAAVMLARRFSARLVLDTQDLWPENFYHLLRAPLRLLGPVLLAMQHRAARQAAQGADALTAVADGYLEHAQRLAGRQVPMQVFPLGIDIGYFDAQADAVPADQRFVTPQGQMWFVYGGGLSRSYDVLTLVEASGLAQTAWGDRVRLFLAGSGELAGALRRRIAELRLTNVEVLDFLPYGRWASLLKAADGSFLAIRSDSRILLPNKIFDYLAGQTAVLSTLPGQAERLLCEHGCGWTYREEDPQACYRAMARLVDDPPACRRAAERGRRLAETQFDHGLVYDRMTAFLEGVAGRA
jgi:glycosyltransferase involved in cell wall biosynthesis